MVTTVLVTGTVGVGKTTVAEAVARAWAERGEQVGFVDLDGLSRLWPAPEDDPFRFRLIVANLASMVGNFRAVGAERLVLAVAVEGRDEVHTLEEAVGGPIRVVRLVASTEVVAERLRQRHVGPELEGLDWHLARNPELHAIQEASDLDAAVVDATGPVDHVASAVMAAVGIRP